MKKTLEGFETIPSVGKQCEPFSIRIRNDSKNDKHVILRITFTSSYKRECRKNGWKYLEILYSAGKKELAFKFTAERESQDARIIDFDTDNPHICCNSLLPAIKDCFSVEKLEYGFTRSMFLVKRDENVFVLKGIKK